MPYYYIAAYYGFANYMFQTNEGPSYPAHQFLFSGTSAPVGPNDPNYYQYFVVNNPSNSNGTGSLSGCPQAVDLSWIDPLRNVAAGQDGNLECYPHDSLVTGSTCQSNKTLCDKSSTLFSSSWRYYAPEPGSIWDAPEAIPEVCYGVNGTSNVPAACGSILMNNQNYNHQNWTSHMTFYSTNNPAASPIFTDIQACQLQQITWVIPDSAWSDHPNSNTSVAYGPSWVADIVNAIGNTGLSSSTSTCNYWGGTANTHATSIEPTAIFIVWDDWGGFYDHVPPFAYNRGGGTVNSWTCNAPNQWGCGYTYGFRVPLLVVSEHTGTKSGNNYSGYISGVCGSTCSNKTSPYIHDFGSILAFTEHNFTLPFIDASGHNLYADYNAPDWDSAHTVPPLSDFFGLSSTRPFVAIPASVNYPPSFFQSYYSTHSGSPMGPDMD
jgi:phospholipase C